MSVIAITSFIAPDHTASTFKELEKILSSTPARSVIGTKVQDATTIQITSEWPEAASTTDLTKSPAYHTFQDQTKHLNATTILATEDSSPFAHGPSPLIEYVKTDFPASSTAEFKAQVEADFARFESIYRKRGDMASTGEVMLSKGWTEEHVKGDQKVISWLVIRGWQNMEAFEKATGQLH